MASVRTNPIPFPSPCAAEPWMELNRDLSAFFDDLEAHSPAAAGWFTPERAADLAALLQRGQELLADKNWPHPDVARQKALYGAHLRLLLGALQALDGQLSQEAERLQVRHGHVAAARAWAISQSPGR